MRDVKIALAVLAVVILHAVLTRYFGFWPVAIVIFVIATIIWAVYPRRAE
ncbi:MAG TPA: hypothetical protein VFQ90_05305 [Stellaceae bacterium]|jgi:hypothetical protein|nr:hypothetical protein [Stellaceae bacterium]